MNNYVYYWEELGNVPNSQRKLLGEAHIGENGVNMSFVIDGTKDSCRLIVSSYNVGEIIKPNNIIWHEDTDTYWVVSNDKVEKYCNEQGWFYIHNLQLEGAIELLNARDLTDCGFNQNTYTIEEFANRLIKLSSLEISCIFNFNNNLDKDKNVDYIKTFENYTLLSALREFFNGYNCSLKMRFSQDPLNSYAIYYAYVDIIPKTGNLTRPYLDFYSDFNDVKEIKTMNKSSYGTTVISNAENIASTKSKMYPNVGYTRIGGENYLIQPSDALIRLPSKVHSVEYVDMVKGKIKITIGSNMGVPGNYTNPHTEEIIFDITNVESYDNAIDWIRNELESNAPSREWCEQNLDDEFWKDAKGQNTINTLMQYLSCRFYDTQDYDPLTNKFISSNTINEFTKGLTNKPYILGDKSLRNGVQEPRQVMYWERGDNSIKGFDFFNYHGTNNVITSKNLQGIQFLSFSQVWAGNTYHYTVIFGECSTNSSVAGYIEPENTKFSLLDTYFKVKYIPMSNIKIKYDNNGNGNDTQLYNQNGKLTDGVALSKLLISYKDEILSDNITKYTNSYDFSAMPLVGDIVIKDNEKYAINNVSLTLYQNEDSYFVEGEYTLSKNVATKSLLTNPNTNIRDYGIPQNYNVERKQLYRDFYEIAYYTDDNADNNYFLYLDKVIPFSNYYKDYISHTAVMKFTYENAYGGGGSDYSGGTVQPSDTWYYQLDTTIYFFKKSMYEIIDFQDNNIIGYDSQNVTCGFDIRRIFEVLQIGTTDIDTINTPISYVDPNGQIKNIDISMCSNEQLMQIYDEYQSEMETLYSENYDGSLYNRCVFIPQEIYNKSKLNCDFEINENNYGKDALEVPVFEYSCQVDDSENVIIGDNIMDFFEDDSRYIYEAILVPHNKVDNNSWSLFIEPKDITFASNIISLDDDNETTRKCIKFSYSTGLINLSACGIYSVSSNAESDTMTNLVRLYDWIINDTQVSVNGKVDLAIIKYTIKNNREISSGVITNVDTNLVMLIKDAKSCPRHIDSSGDIRLVINHYKLK